MQEEEQQLGCVKCCGAVDVCQLRSKGIGPRAAGRRTTADDANRQADAERYAAPGSDRHSRLGLGPSSGQTIVAAVAC